MKKPRKSEPKADPNNDPAHLFRYYRKLSLDPSKSETERFYARQHMMDCWNAIPGLTSNLDIKD
jgi:hypothetical protein